jgi:uracil-DNA glycosylase family 4
MKKPDSCQGCPLHEKGFSFSVPEGTGSLGVLIVGEALGDHESREGLPFRPYAPAGSVLERVIRASRFDRQQFAIWNVVACRPPRDWLEGAPWEYGAIEHCRRHFAPVVERYRPRVILALGRIALRAMTGLAGKNQGIEMLRGYTFPYYHEGYNIGEIEQINQARKYSVVDPQPPIEAPPTRTWVHPSFHPSFIRRGATNMIGVLAYDLMKAVELAQGSGFRQKPVKYLTHPTHEDIRDFIDFCRANPTRVMTYDIETPNSRDMPEDAREEDPSYELISIQFSHTPYTGMFLDANRPAEREAARILLSLPNPKAGHNSWDYDNPRLWHNGFSIAGKNYDTMWLFHHLQPDLPMNLQFAASFFGMDFPWKHLDNIDPEFYGCADVDAPQRIMATGLQALEQRGILDSYERYVCAVKPGMQKMTDRGIPVNNERRLAFRQELVLARDEVDVKIQAKVPENVRRVHPKEGYKLCPVDLKPYLEPGQRALLPVEREDICSQVFEDREEEGEGVNKKVKVHYYRYRVREFDDPITLADNPANLTPEGKIPRWARVYNFAPKSPKQVINYMKAMGHPVPKNLKEVDLEGNAKDTTDAKELERLANKTNDPLYRWLIEWRSFDTMRATFVDGFVPSQDGRVHSTFTFAPANWQLSSRGPNVQNWPVHVGLAQKFLWMLEAPAGRVWVVMDFKSFHPAMLALEAQDPAYMRIVRLDVHSYLTAHFMKLPERDKALSWDDDTLRDWLAWVKKHHRHVRDYKCKRVVCGWGNGQGYRLCFNQWREYFENETECKRLFGTMDSLFEKTTACKKHMAETAHNQRYLLSRYKAIRWFWDVFHWDGSRGKLVQGKDHEKAQAFLPPNHAFGHVRDNMLELGELGWDDRFSMVNNVHDALYFLPLKEYQEECVTLVRDLLQKPNRTLATPGIAPSGMWVEVGVKTGRNLADRVNDKGEVWNPEGIEELKLARPDRPLVGY